MQFALVDITDHARSHRLAVGKAWIENAIPAETRAQVLTAAVAAMVPVGPREIRRITIRITTMSAGVLTAAHYSLILRRNNYGTLTATILA
ncbi:hypothetical protein ACIRRA_44590 [Nocardia sp. NPDC101769]|uniref:hypothetical protein n=1 Tax=Nocardia sp. NPDC101769 TaxID=3364333 RepID=UPI0038184B4E